jgi:atypical dual specificity phosphatase
MFDPSEILPWLFIGSESAARSVVIRDGGSLAITHVLNVSDNVFYSPFSDTLELLHVPMADNGTTVLAERLDKCFAFIESGRPSDWEPSRNGKPHADSGLNLKKRVLVHCIVGVNRSATIVIAYIMATYRWNLEDTLELVIQPLLYMY